ncbi:MAG: hypothetical protein AB1351_07505 [Thermoproteota archaeon]
MPKMNFIGTDIILTQMTFTDTNGKTTKVFYLDTPSTPQIILDLDSQIEQLIEKYDDGIVDCTYASIRDCPVQEPKLDDESDEDTGLLLPENESMVVGEPVEVFEVNDNSTTIEIEYTE